MTEEYELQVLEEKRRVLKDKIGKKKAKHRSQVWRDSLSPERKAAYDANLKRISRTLIGKLRRVYNSQLRNSRKRGHEAPKYTLDEFVEFYKNNETYKQLHAEWEKSGFLKYKAPSFDRLDNSKGYSFSNLQIVTFKKNNKLAHQDMRDNKIISSHTEIVQIVDEVVVARFSSLTEAERITGISAKSISNVVNGRAKKTRDESIWCSEGNIEEAILRSKAIHKLSKEVLQYTLDGSYLNSYENTRLAAEAVGLKSSSNIRATCDGRRTQAGGYVWKYKP